MEYHSRGIDGKRSGVPVGIRFVRSCALVVVRLADIATLSGLTFRLSLQDLIMSFRKIGALRVLRVNAKQLQVLPQLRLPLRMLCRYP
jgi:hypothetical protein